MSTAIGAANPGQKLRGGGRVTYLAEGCGSAAPS